MLKSDCIIQTTRSHTQERMNLLSECRRKPQAHLELRGWSRNYTTVDT